MPSIAFRLLAEEFIDDEQQQMQQQRIVRRDLRDGMNPLELPQCLFEKYYRVNKHAFMYLLEMLMAKLKPAKKQFEVPPVVKLSGCLRFIAEGGYQTGVGKDSDVALAQSQQNFSKILTEVLEVFETHLCHKWITVCRTTEEKREVALSLYVKHGIPGVM